MPTRAAFRIAGCLAACLVLLMQPGAAQEVRGLRSDAAPTARSNAGTAMRFDIPSKTLQDALDDFDAATGFSGLYGADAVAFQQSVAVHGQFTPEAALRQLLAQSGLRSYFTARDAYVLEADAGIVVAASSPAPQAGSDFEALLQSGVRAAFCRNALIAPGDYRIALSFRVTATGRVERARGRVAAVGRHRAPVARRRRPVAGRARYSSLALRRGGALGRRPLRQPLTATPPAGPSSPTSPPPLRPPP